MAGERRLDSVTVAAAVLAVSAAAATFPPWGRSGERTRSSYELIDVAGRAGVLDEGTAWAAPLWFLVPAACGLAVLALATGRRALGGVVTTTLGALVCAGAILVLRSPLVAEPAVVAATVLGAGTVLGGVAVLVTARKGMAG